MVAGVAARQVGRKRGGAEPPMLLVLTFENMVLTRLQVGSDDLLADLGEGGHLLAALLGRGGRRSR